ncbi:mnng and nitrosoguanidine resistance protein [Stemphylium lycopersici]|nr:mnng and nitrosoguanidine resistance protein [Stemphylium lycopersici]
MAPQLRLPRAFRPPAQINSEEGTNGHPETNRGKTAPKEAEDGNKTGERSERPNTEPVGFWHPDLRQVRNRAFVKWIITTSFLMAFILAVLSIYWGVFFKVQNRISNLLVYVVDMDGVAPYDNTGNAPFVGPTIIQLVQQQLSSGQPTLGWDIRPASDFTNDPIQVREAIYEWDAWAAIVINPNASALLYSAIANGNASYDPLGACQLIYQDSRDDTNWFDFMLPIISSFVTEAQSMVGQQWAQMLLQNASDPSILSNMQNAPQAINPAIGFSKYNLRPFFPYTGIPAVSIGLIYLIIISFFSFSFYMPIHMQYITPTNHPPLKFRQLIIWRWCATLSAYFMLSLAYSFVSMAFQINFWDTNSVTSQTQVTIQSEGNPVAFGSATFVVYWMLNFCGMVALGLACENMAMIVGMPWMGLFLIFWVITNVSTAFYDIEIAPAFYRWGYAWPLHSIVEGSRTILFDLHSRLGLDFGILIAWGAVNTLFFPFCCWFMRWKTQRGVHEYWPLD